MTQPIVDLVVTPEPIHPQRGTVRCGDKTFPCVLGRSGVSTAKREGDGATPAGRFPLRRVLYRQDRVATPMTALPSAPIGEHDGWCDEPDNVAYNCPVTLPHDASAENLWRDDALYDIIGIIGHNDHPAIPGAGSAIFLHIAASDGTPTEGCVALSHDDLIAVLRMLGPSSVIDIRPEAS